MPASWEYHQSNKGEIKDPSPHLIASARQSQIHKRWLFLNTSECASSKITTMFDTMITRGQPSTPAVQPLTEQWAVHGFSQYSVLLYWQKYFPGICATYYLHTAREQLSALHSQPIYFITQFSACNKSIQILVCIVTRLNDMDSSAYPVGDFQRLIQFSFPMFWKQYNGRNEANGANHCHTRNLRQIRVNLETITPPKAKVKRGKYVCYPQFPWSTALAVSYRY